KGFSDRLLSILIQSDGKIMLAGESDGKFALARYQPGFAVGTTDVFMPSFGSLEISPNPANDFLNIQLPEPVAGPIEIIFFDQRGSLISRQEIEEGQPVKIRSLPDGMYTITTILKDASTQVSLSNQDNEYTAV
ncbi:MAG: T9SS type A sorting domain-containing protein, partial [Phaeodactylibacter sp.]|nr:T9SS type A sorting domain-containing protein [Phaeodactylibacter sp.]